MHLDYIYLLKLMHLHF